MIESSQRRPRRPMSPSLTPSERVYVVPTADDVLRGRGGRTNTHPGNQRLLELVRPLEAEYAALKRGQKGLMSLGMVDKVHAWGGRFLEKEVNSRGKELFYIMEPQSAVKLVEQKFRDEPIKRKTRINKRFKQATRKAKKNKDHEEYEESVVVADHELLDFEEYKSWDFHLPVPVTIPDQTAEDMNVLEASPVHCVSPAHTLEDAEIELDSDNEIEADDLSVTEEEISELISDPYAWGKFPCGFLVDDPSLYFSDDRLIDFWFDGDDLCELSS